MKPLLLRLPLLLLGFAVLMGAVLVFSLVRSGMEAQGRVEHLPPLEEATIQNGDFRSGLAHWNTWHISAAAQSDVTESAQRRTFARLTKPPEWKKSATM